LIRYQSNSSAILGLRGGTVHRPDRAQGSHKLPARFHRFMSFTTSLPADSGIYAIASGHVGTLSTSARGRNITSRSDRRRPIADGTNVDPRPAATSTSVGIRSLTSCTIVGRKPCVEK